MASLSLFTIVVRAIVLLTSIPVHEYAHAYVADRLGDPTARYEGRLTLNPTAHFDVVGSLALILTGIGWAKPVHINASNFKNPKKGMALSAAAGPIANLLLATVSMILMKLIMYAGFASSSMGTGIMGTVIVTMYQIFSTMCSINISLAIFNLLPIPPFDGSRVINYILPDKYYFAVMKYERVIFVVLLLVLMLGILDRPLSFLSRAVYSLLDSVTFIFDKIFSVIF